MSTEAEREEQEAFEAWLHGISTRDFRASMRMVFAETTVGIELSGVLRGAFAAGKDYGLRLRGIAAEDREQIAALWRALRSVLKHRPRNNVTAIMHWEQAEVVLARTAERYGLGEE